MSRGGDINFRLADEVRYSAPNHFLCLKDDQVLETSPLEDEETRIPMVRLLFC